MNSHSLSLSITDYESRLQECLASAPRGQPSPRDLFATADDDFWFWLNTQGYRQNVSLRQVMPAAPDDVTQDRFTGRHGDDTLRDGFRFYLLVKQMVETHLQGLDRCDKILDFGCGWGRIIRFFLRDLAPAKVSGWGRTIRFCLRRPAVAKVWGIDCLPEAIDICRATNRWCQFHLVPTMPPSKLPAASFDLVYAYSVFSHLSEDAHRQWLREFHRILKPAEWWC